MSELKPCPFCGCDEIKIKTRKTTIVECDRCGALIIGCVDGIGRDAIAAWNKRIPTDAVKICPVCDIAGCKHLRGME